ncbi:MAG: helix-turn-helix domain-containing protein [Verrucomicrobiae bacterium]|nr:helix-turn-helix domain-containing protein [Verrucomicrobiae bacterium]
MRRLLLTEFISPDQTCHFARRKMESIRSATPPPFHTHNYHEIFWVEEGTGRHWINKQQDPLRPGVCYFIRSTDSHAFNVDPEHPFHLVNISFSITNWQSFHKRFFNKKPDPFLLPLVRRKHFLSTRGLEEARGLVMEMAAGKSSRATLERFLLNFLHLLENTSSAKGEAPPPDWLEKACRDISQPCHFRNGARGFARLAGRSAEHVARELQRFSGKTPTAVVNEARMRHAAALLANSREKILNIVLECGFQNVAHFYQVFKRQFGASPRRYRLLQQKIVQPPRD